MNIGEIARDRMVAKAQDDAVALVRKCENIWVLLAVIRDLTPADVQPLTAKPTNPEATA